VTRRALCDGAYSLRKLRLREAEFVAHRPDATIVVTRFYFGERQAAGMGVVPFRTGGRGLVNRLTSVGTVLGAIEYARGSWWESGVTTVRR
jgi:hypothetical protein